MVEPATALPLSKMYDPSKTPGKSMMRTPGQKEVLKLIPYNDDTKKKLEKVVKKNTRVNTRRFSELINGKILRPVSSHLF